jgi:hypothetical protein
MEFLWSCCFTNTMPSFNIHLLHKRQPIQLNSRTEEIHIESSRKGKTLTHRNFFIALSQPDLPASDTVECWWKTEDKHSPAYSFKVGTLYEGSASVVILAVHLLFLLRPMTEEVSRRVYIIMNQQQTNTWLNHVIKSHDYHLNTEWAHIIFSIQTSPNYFHISNSASIYITSVSNLHTTFFIPLQIQTFPQHF